MFQKNFLPLETWYVILCSLFYKVFDIDDDTFFGHELENIFFITFTIILYRVLYSLLPWIMAIFYVLVFAMEHGKLPVAFSYDLFVLLYAYIFLLLSSQFKNLSMCSYKGLANSCYISRKIYFMATIFVLLSFYLFYTGVNLIWPSV